MPCYVVYCLPHVEARFEEELACWKEDVRQFDMNSETIHLGVSPTPQVSSISPIPTRFGVEPQGFSGALGRQHSLASYDLSLCQEELSFCYSHGLGSGEQFLFCG
jgi:hypothetical protein